MRPVSRELLVCASLAVAITVLGFLAVSRFQPRGLAVATYGGGFHPRSSSLSIRGVTLGSQEHAIKGRLPVTRLVYDAGRCTAVEGRQLERAGRPILTVGQHLSDAVRMLGKPDREGFVPILCDFPAVRYSRHQLTLILVPGSTAIGSIVLSDTDEVRTTPSSGVSSLR